MGPETMNSFQTTYTAAIRFGIDKKDYQKLVKFANIVGRIGNMTLTYKGKNRYIAYDYWDIKINRQYIIDDKLSDIAKKRYINTFFQWDYVDVKNNAYVIKEFWEGHNKKYKINENCIPTYIDKIDVYTKRRGIFMIGMLKIHNVCENDYMLI